MQTPVAGLVSAIIVTWNSADTLAACLQSLKAQTYRDIELIVVDNASTDSSIEIVEAQFPTARIILQASNTGFCQGQNTGISLAQGEYVMPLNPDVRMDQDFVASMVLPMTADSAIGIVTGKLFLPLEDPVTKQRLIDTTGLFVTRSRRQYLRGHGEPDSGQFDAAGYVFGACGAAPLYRREMLQAIMVDGEYFDTAFFAHKEDLDLTWRAQVLGWKAWFEPAATADHDRSFRPGRRGVMSDEVKVHAVKNRYLTMIKNDLPVNLFRDILHILAYDLRIIGYILVFERASLPGIFMAIRIAPETLRKRRIIMRNRSVEASYIRATMR